MIYLDSSALIKLVLDERESADLELWLSSRPDEPLVSSELATVEVIRSIRRLSPPSLTEARAILGPVSLIPLSSSVVRRAADLPDPLLRSLDALHLASALIVVEELTAFVTYDRRLSVAATAAGLGVIQPGS